MLNRRDFLQLAAAALSGVFLSSKPLLAKKTTDNDTNPKSQEDLRIVTFGTRVFEPVERLGVKQIKRLDRTFVRRVQLCFNPDEAENIFYRHKNPAHGDLFDNIRMLIGLFIGGADKLLIVQGIYGNMGANIMKVIPAGEHTALGTSVSLLDGRYLSLISSEDTSTIEAFFDNAQRFLQLQAETGLDVMPSVVNKANSIRSQITIDMLSSSGISSAVLDAIFDTSLRDNLEICLPNYPIDFDNLRVRG